MKMLQKSKLNENSFVIVHNREQATHFQNEAGQIEVMTDEQPLQMRDMFLSERAVADDDAPLGIPPMFDEPEDAVEGVGEPLQMPTMNFERSRS